jgi:exopolysaccharide biosynthesis polyprenyl glycosylphosphotransferase
VRDYVIVGLGVLPLWYILLWHRGLYEPRRGLSRRGDESRKLVEVSTLGTLVVASGTFFWREVLISRLVLLLFWLLSSGGLVLFRATLRKGLAELRKRGFNTRNVLIVGTGTLARAVYERFRDDPETGFQVIGFLGPSVTGLGDHTPPNLGSFVALHEVVSHHQVDQVVIALDRGDPADPIKMLHDLHDTTAAVRLVPDLLGLRTLQAGIEDFADLPMIRLVESPLVGWSQLLKHAFDFSVASLGLVLISPLLAAIALGIRWTSPGGGVLYQQERMGLDGRLFSMLKFRTMVPNAEAETGARWAERDDPRRTRFGALLRTLSLDELPQLWNVVRGEMSLVGPRPERPEFIREFRKQIPGYMLRHKMKAGMTGWAQINGCRGNTSIEKRLEYDIDYARRWSLLFDLKILALTFFRLFRDPNAY